MAKSRTYRHDVRCPNCGSNWMPKDGFSGGRPTAAAIAGGVAPPACADAGLFVYRETLWQEGSCLTGNFRGGRATWFTVPGSSLLCAFATGVFLSHYRARWRKVEASLENAQFFAMCAALALSIIANLTLCHKLTQTQRRRKLWQKQQSTAF